MIIRSCRGTSTWLGRFISSLKSNFFFIYEMLRPICWTECICVLVYRMQSGTGRSLLSLQLKTDAFVGLLWIRMVQAKGHWSKDPMYTEALLIPRFFKTAICPLLSWCLTLMWDDLCIPFIQLMSNAAFEKSWCVPLPWNLELEKTQKAQLDSVASSLKFMSSLKPDCVWVMIMVWKLRAMARWKVTKTRLMNWWLRSLDFQ